MYYRGASAAILVFDISKRDSFAVMKVPRPLPAMEGGPFPLRPVPSRAFPLPRATASRRGYSLAGDEETAELHRCSPQPTTGNMQGAALQDAARIVTRVHLCVCVFAAAVQDWVLELQSNLSSDLGTYWLYDCTGCIRAQCGAGGALSRALTQYRRAP